MRFAIKIEEFIEDTIENSRETIDFIFYFSRFECALKNEGYLANKEHAEANWEDFFCRNTNEIENIFEKESLAESINYLNDSPPKKQIRKARANTSPPEYTVDWETTIRPTPKTEAVKDSIKRIRNNLFHGGKFPTGPADEPSRDKKLISSALKILQELSKMDKVEKYFSLLKHDWT